MTIGDRLKLRLEKLELKQKELAKLIEISATTLNGYFTDYREPDSETLKKLAKYLETSVGYLIGETDDPDPPTKNLQDLYIPEDLEGVGLAFHKGEDGLTQDEIDKIAEFTRFIKSQRPKDKEGE